MIRRATGVVALMMLVSACGGGGGSEATDVTSENSTTTTVGAEPSSGGETLASFFGWGDTDDAAAEARARQQHSDLEEAKQRCMREQGFEYIPVPASDDMFSFSSEDQRAQVETQGFGITTWYGNEEPVTDDWEDPNADQVAAMSESEQQAYWEAMYGSEDEFETSTEIDPETGEEITYSSGIGGCQGEAQSALFGQFGDLEEAWEQLEPAIEEMTARIESDPRVVEITAAWSACMAEAGFEYETRNAMWDDAFDSFQTRLDEIIGTGGEDPFEGMSETEVEAFFDERTDEEIDAFFAEQQRLEMESIDREALDALQQEEISLAVADSDCGVAYDEVFAEVSAEYEQSLIDENRALLEQVRGSEGSS